MLGLICIFYLMFTTGVRFLGNAMSREEVRAADMVIYGFEMLAVVGLVVYMWG